MSIFSAAIEAARREPAGRASWFWYGSAIAAGLLFPILVILVGVVAYLLEHRGIDQSPLRLGVALAVPVPQSWLQQTALGQLCRWVMIGLVAAIGWLLANWSMRIGSDRRCRAVLTGLHRQLLPQSLRRAEAEGAISQRERAQALVERRLPHLARGLTAWWQAVPRTVLMLVGCIAVALAVHPLLALLAVIGGGLLWQLQRWLRRRGETLPGDWEVPRSRRRLVDLIGRAPLLAKTHTGGVADQAYEAELDQLMHQIAVGQRLRRGAAPMMALAGTAVVTLLVLGLGVNLLATPSQLSLSSALVMGLSLGGAVWAAMRLAEAVGLATSADEAGRAVHQFLQPMSDRMPSEQRVGLAGVRQAVVLSDVSMQLDNDQSVLSGISLELHPGELVCLLGSSSVSVLALAELLLGIGRPTGGRIEIDGIGLNEIHPLALAKNVLWVGADGPISDGTLLQNIVGEQEPPGGTAAVLDAMQTLGLDSLLGRLEDGLHTNLNADDARLPVEDKYLVGMARGLVHQPPIIVVQEPPPPPDELSGDRVLEAMRRLADQNRLVIVLPRRLPTLRQADRVVLLSGSKLAGEGKHNTLLQSSDLYRHLNYLLFNPYRSLG